MQDEKLNVAQCDLATQRKVVQSYAKMTALQQAMKVEDDSKKSWLLTALTFGKMPNIKTLVIDDGVFRSTKRKILAKCGTKITSLLINSCELGNGIGPYQKYISDLQKETSKINREIKIHSQRLRDQANFHNQAVADFAKDAGEFYAGVKQFTDNSIAVLGMVHPGAQEVATFIQEGVAVVDKLFVRTDNPEIADLMFFKGTAGNIVLNLSKNYLKTRYVNNPVMKEGVEFASRGVSAIVGILIAESEHIKNVGKRIERPRQMTKSPWASP